MLLQPTVFRPLIGLQVITEMSQFASLVDHDVLMTLSHPVSTPDSASVGTVSGVIVGVSATHVTVNVSDDPGEERLLVLNASFIVAVADFGEAFEGDDEEDDED